jgi:hypothetical protein
MGRDRDIQVELPHCRTTRLGKVRQVRRNLPHHHPYPRRGWWVRQCGKEGSEVRQTSGRHEPSTSPKCSHLLTSQGANHG